MDGILLGAFLGWTFPGIFIGAFIGCAIATLLIKIGDGIRMPKLSWMLVPQLLLCLAYPAILIGSLYAINSGAHHQSSAAGTLPNLTGKL